MLAVAVVEPGKVKLVEIPEPIPGHYEVKVKTEISCLCNATDRKLIDGCFPGIQDYPLLLGHESVGTVESVGERVRTFKPGDRAIGGLLLNPIDTIYASGWGGFCEYTIITDHEAMTEDGVADAEHDWREVHQIQRAVPKKISAEAAVMLCTWREVYAAFSDFNLKRGDDILIIGTGPVGLSFVKFAKLLGLGYVGVIARKADKRRKAIELGATQVFTAEDPDLQRLKETRGKPLDAVIDAVGKEEIINSALSLIKMAGSICVYGVIDKPSIIIEKSGGPYNFNLLVHQWPTRMRESAAQEPLCKWISEGKLSYADFVSDEFPISRIEDAIKLMRSGRALKILLRY